MLPRFSPEALTFLRSLKRNNDREWFRARKDRYETLLRAPMIATIERLAEDLRLIAPDLAVNPKVSLFRPYRDTRFSEDKSPLKTHVGAVFPCRVLPKLGGASLYFEIAPQHVWIGGGLYRPDTSQLQAVRQHIAGNFRRLRVIVESPAFRRSLGALEGERLQRMPLGFARDHEAGEYLRLKQFIAGSEHPAAFATRPRFYSDLLGVFRQVAPLVRFLNEPLLKG
jgi:uncharacterized protein (TIGR02453 family)